MADGVKGFDGAEAPPERRVALSPEAVSRLSALGIDMLVEAGAGAQAWFSDEAYEQAGATVRDDDAARKEADVIVTVGRPDRAGVAAMHAGQTLIGLLRPLTDPELASELAAAGVTAISLDGLPRTVSRAQSMDALSSQASVAGYKAALVAADAYERLLPDADHRGRHRAAGRGAGARRRRGRAAGDRHRPAARRGGHRRTTSGRQPAAEVRVARAPRSSS